MRNIDGKRLVDALRDEGLSPYAYAGRGMFSTRCVGVDGEGLRPLAAAVEAYLAGCEDADEAAEAAGALIRGASMDSMGLGSVIYWPALRWTDDMEDEAGEEDE